MILACLRDAHKCLKGIIGSEGNMQHTVATIVIGLSGKNEGDCIFVP